MADDSKPESKQFSLKPIEKQMLQVLQDQYFTTLSNFLSFIALERLAYQVTENTQFTIEGDNLVISEKEPEATPAAPDAPAVATADQPTKDAIKKG